jgi:hypothetical protein
MNTDYLLPLFSFNAASGLNKINNMKEKATYLKHNWKTNKRGLNEKKTKEQSLYINFTTPPVP